MHSQTIKKIHNQSICVSGKYFVSYGDETSSLIIKKNVSKMNV